MPPFHKAVGIQYLQVCMYGTICGKKYSEILLSLSLELMDNNDFYRFSLFCEFSEMIINVIINLPS